MHWLQTWRQIRNRKEKHCDPLHKLFRSMPQYGATGEHVVYVSVGEPHQRFGQPRRRTAALCAGALGVALVACLTYRGAGGGSSLALAQGGEYKPRGADKLAARLAQAQARSEIVRGASAALPRVAKSALTSLVSSRTTKLEVDCAQAGAYTTLQSTFAGLAANLTAHNSSIYAEDAARAKAASEAKVAWLSSQASFRTAESSHVSATAAATYAKGMYDQYATAKEAGLAEYNKAIVPINAEKEELTTAIPIIKMVQKMVDDIIAERLAAAAAAKSGVQQLHMASVSAKQRVKLASLADRIVVPKRDASLRAMAASMKTILDLPAGEHLDVHMLKKLPTKIIASMEARLEEIAATTQKMNGMTVPPSPPSPSQVTRLSPPPHTHPTCPCPLACHHASAEVRPCYERS
jgi:hypothetical protein